MDAITTARKTILGIQMLFVAFGALILVPLLTGLDPSIALFTAGAGTLLFHAITGGSVPIFLASSFAFIAPIQYAMKAFGPGATFGALFCTGLIYLLFSVMARLGGANLLNRYLPPIVTGPVIMVIGLKLAPVAVGMTRSFSGSGPPESRALVLAACSLLTAVGAVMYGKKLLSLIPILCGIIAGYLVALIMGVVDFTPIHEAHWFQLPWTLARENGSFALPRFDPAAILYMLPVALAPAIEHVGDILAISSVTGRNYLVRPGLHRTLLGDGLATSLAGLLGGPPNTTYSEVTGAVALTKAFDPVLMRIAAVTAIVLAFAGKLGAIMRTIPGPVMGGIMLLLFGMIAAIGINSLVKAHVDMSRSRNLVIASVILTSGIGDMTVTCGRFCLGGIGLAGLVGVLLNLILPGRGEAHDIPCSE
ncbi:MAG: uracil-xanthine permease [Kiritimatiellae bacterium]|nr:uracil-xanthine permease [Kiritimatiellia bacterium]NLD89784.1 uracil-xanthine permease [Lentisphaerota bacterium]HQN80381.1 uracil-xanthine permease family protein [Kiritimatiellia bacterium]HQQ59910.1 uracil-xanthine permease family protein [Kiritimatiellia bacterium]